MEQSSEKTSELCSQVDCRRGRDGVKGQDERQRTAPLTPSRPPQESCALKGLDRSRRCHTRKLQVPGRSRQPARNNTPGTHANLVFLRIIPEVSCAPVVNSGAVPAPGKDTDHVAAQMVAFRNAVH